jgi:hypothetical protein
VSVIVITGAAGLVGSMLRPRLARPGRTLRVLDIAPLTAGPEEEAIQASVTDIDAMTAACQGADAVIHLAGIHGDAGDLLIVGQRPGHEPRGRGLAHARYGGDRALRRRRDDRTRALGLDDGVSPRHLPGGGNLAARDGVADHPGERGQRKREDEREHGQGRRQ